MILAVLFFISTLRAEVGVMLNEGEYSFNHPTCLLRFDSSMEFADKISSKLQEKGFKLHDFLPDGKLNSEDMYFALNIERIGLLFKECKLTYRIAEASTIKPVTSDRKLLSSSTTRAFPRVTFDGDERCRRGIDDLFVNVPTCRSGKLLIKSKQPSDQY